MKKGNNYSSPGTATREIDGKRSDKRRKSIEQCRLISEKMSAPCKLWAAHPTLGDGEFIKRDCRVETLRVFCSQEGEKRGGGRERRGWRKIETKVIVEKGQRERGTLGRKQWNSTWWKIFQRVAARWSCQITPPTRCPASRAPSMVPGVPVIFRNIAESRGGPVAELAGYRWLGKSFSNGKENWLHRGRSGKWKTLL